MTGAATPITGSAAVRASPAVAPTPITVNASSVRPPPALLPLAQKLTLNRCKALQLLSGQLQRGTIKL
jgi:hypothetical protein